MEMPARQGLGFTCSLSRLGAALRGQGAQSASLQSPARKATLTAPHLRRFIALPQHI